MGLIRKATYQNIGIESVKASRHHGSEKEGSCLIHGILYFVSVQPMQMLLLLYSLGNLHVVSWGTREVKTVASTDVKDTDNSKTSETGYTLSIGQILRCIWCPKRGKRDLEYKDILNKLEELERKISNTQTTTHSEGTMEITEVRQQNTDNDNGIEEEQEDPSKKEENPTNIVAKTCLADCAGRR